MSSTLLWKPTLATSHSLTSITIPTVKNKNLDPILTNLQNRKKQLMETLSKKDIKSPQQQQREDKIKKMQDKKCSLSQIDQNKQKKRKYEMKIEKQRQECENIKRDVQCVQNETLRCVADREDCEVRIKRISEEVGIKYRYAFGIEQANCQQSRKWIYHKILELQQKIETSPLNMRKLMCKIYSQEIVKTDIIENKIPVQTIFEYIIKMRLVNKLYGIILANKISKKQENKNKQDIQHFKNLMRSRSSISSINSEIDSSCLSECEEGEEEVVGVEDEYIGNGDDDWYQTWVSILKLMKKLQKMQSILLVNDQQQDQRRLQPQTNIAWLKKQIKLLLQEQRRQKIKIRDKQKLVKQLKNKKTQLEQDLKIKQEYIEQLKQKVDKYESIILKSINNSNKNNENECCNPANPHTQDKQNPSKEHIQLRQIQEAINYFTIKKNTYTQVTREIEKQTNDISVTTMLSPIKSTIRNEIMTSPHLKSTIRRSNKKYSLKDLLSPTKNYMVLDKKQAWK